MPAERKTLIAGNWKMNSRQAEARSLIEGILARLPDAKAVEVVLAPPFTALAEAARVLAGSPVQLAGQNMHWEAQGAFTGEISASMLLDAGCQFVILGHSERRQLFGETDAMVNAKLRAALAAGLKVIFCIGETGSERDAGETEAVLSRQLVSGLEGVTPVEAAALVIAYEPVWAIGTGRNATPGQAQEAHRQIRSRVGALAGEAAARSVRILYGGSVKPDNSAGLLELEDVDGVLVGGASLVADSFCDIMASVL